MIGNLSKVDQRLKTYFAVPDKRFEVKSGLSPQEEAVKQRVRQYWADDSISNIKKLEGLNLDLSGFDPRKTSNKQLRDIAAILAEVGIIDGDLVGVVSGIDVQFDSQGKEVNMTQQVNAYQFFEKELGVLRDVIAEGNEFAKGALVELKTAISVVMALEEYAKSPRERSLINIKA